MKSTITQVLVVLASMLVIMQSPLQASTTHCSLSSTTGKWAYTYTGILTPSGGVPAASVGH
jgi:hypothetical protein